MKELSINRSFSRCRQQKLCNPLVKGARRSRPKLALSELDPRTDFRPNFDSRATTNAPSSRAEVQTSIVSIAWNSSHGITNLVAWKAFLKDELRYV
jgi:hypothetical protein